MVQYLTPLKHFLLLLISTPLKHSLEQDLLANITMIKI